MIEQLERVNIKNLSDQSFIKLDDIMSEDKFKVYASQNWEEIPVRTVMVDRVLSAPFVNSWEETLKVLPSVYLSEILNGKINISSSPLSLLEYQGIYIAVGIDWKTAIYKKWGVDIIPAQVIKVEEEK